MFSLFNRLAWILSLTVGLIFCTTLFELFDGRPSFIDALFAGVICGIVFKYIALSPDFIRRAISEHLSTVAVDVAHSRLEDATRESDPTRESSEDRSLDQDTPSLMLDHPVYQSRQVDVQEDESWERARRLSEEEHSNSVLENTAEKEITREPSRFTQLLRSFFADRPLAKIGGVLLFLGSFFFLYLIFEWAGPFGKVIMGLLFGFSLIGGGIFLDRRGITTESRVLLGVGIAINYLTILSGHYLLGMGGIDDVMIFSDIATTIFLLLNTSLAVVMALLYQSRPLLGFAFIFAYLTPFLIGASSDTSYLLSIYATIITLAIAAINFFSQKISGGEHRSYLELIALIGMSALFSLSSIASGSLGETLVLCAGFLLSVFAFALSVWKMKSSPLPLLLASYIVVFVLAASSGGVHTFDLIPILLVPLLILSLLFGFIGMLGVTSLVGISAAIFGISIVGYLVDGMMVSSLNSLFLINLSLFVIFGVLILRHTLLLLGSVVMIGMTLTFLFAIVTLDSIVPPLSSLLLGKSLCILFLCISSVFALRNGESRLFVLSLVLSGVLLLIPSMSGYPGYHTLITGVFALIALIIPALFLQRKNLGGSQRAYILVALSIGALVLVAAIYQIARAYDIGSLATGFIYLIQSGIYLAYALFLGRTFIASSAQIVSSPESSEGRTTLLILFALPLSLATFALAFIFRENASVMSLAWIMESLILALVYTRMYDRRILMATCFVFFIGIAQYIALVSTLHTRDYLALGISLLALVSVLTGVFVLRSDSSDERLGYDILHIISILSISAGVSQIIPSTGTGWSLFGMIAFLGILSPLYASYGKAIHKRFLSVALGVFVFVFFAKFSGLLHETLLQLAVQFASLILLLLTGYIGFRSKELSGYIQFAISIFGFLLISSLYVNEFINTFAVSIYLTIVATFLIVRGIMSQNAKFRTIGLYIGTFALMKILSFDIWTEIDGSIAKVVALMISGGLMIYLSQLYGRYVERSWKEEFDLSQVWKMPEGGASTDKKTIHTGSQHIGGSPFHSDLAKELEHISASEFAEVRFIALSGEMFTTKRESVIQLARYITLLMKKDYFAPGELTHIYNRVTHSLVSHLDTEELRVILSSLESWIVSGGSIEFIPK